MKSFNTSIFRMACLKCGLKQIIYPTVKFLHCFCEKQATLKRWCNRIYDFFIYSIMYLYIWLQFLTGWKESFQIYFFYEKVGPRKICKISTWNLLMQAFEKTNLYSSVSLAGFHKVLHIICMYFYVINIFTNHGHLWTEQMTLYFVNLSDAVVYRHICEFFAKIW